METVPDREILSCRPAPAVQRRRSGSALPQRPTPLSPLGVKSNTESPRAHDGTNDPQLAPTLLVAARPLLQATWPPCEGAALPLRRTGGCFAHIFRQFAMLL
jgi:hypothetical protein